MSRVEKARSAARSRTSLLATGLAAGLMAAALPTAAMAAPSDVVIGVLDVRADGVTHKVKGVDVVYREFLSEGATSASSECKSGHDHGQIVVTAAVDEIRRIDPTVPIRVYSANAFSEIPTRAGGKALRMNFDKAAEALGWMHDSGVRVVVTAFNTRNVEGSKKIMDRAQELGMTVFAGASNDRGMGRVLPAADPRAISIADTTPGKSSLTMDPTVEQWVRFGMNGSLSVDGHPGGSDEYGSSFASAKASAYGAYYQSRVPSASPSEIVDALARIAPVRRFHAGSHQVRVPTLGLDGMPATFRAYVDVVVAARPATVQVASATIDSSLGAAAMAMASRGGASR
jgi:hypothetical protein